MIAHIIHDKSGKVISVAFQASNVKGQLEIQSDRDGEFVTVVDLSKVLPDSGEYGGPDSAQFRYRVNEMARDICSGYQVDFGRKTLKKMK